MFDFIRQNEHGQLEAIPETIHLLLNENEITLEQQDELLASDTQEYQNNEIEPRENQEERQDYSNFVKGEPPEQVIEEEEQFEQQYEGTNDDTDVKPGRNLTFKKLFTFKCFHICSKCFQYSHK